MIKKWAFWGKKAVFGCFLLEIGRFKGLTSLGRWYNFVVLFI